MTLDNDANAGASRLAAQAASLSAQPVRPVVRLVLDAGSVPGAYRRAVQALSPVAYLMGELGDSSELAGVPAAAYRRFVQAMVTAFSAQVSLWEVGNEVNGEWLGSIPEVRRRIEVAYRAVRRVGGRTALTLYYNPGCWSKASARMFPWAETQLPAALRAGLDYVLISYYPGECNNYWPTVAAWQTVFDRLGRLFPHARLGFGEAGTATPRSLAPTAQASLLTRYYALPITGSRYVGGYFWWYYAETCVPFAGSAPWQALVSVERRFAPPRA